MGVTLSSTARMAGCQNVTRWEDDIQSSPQTLHKRDEARRVSRVRYVHRESRSSGTSRIIADSYIGPPHRAHHRRLLTPLLQHPLLPPTPLVIPLGAMPKSTLHSFRSYASYALAKLSLLGNLSDAEIETVMLEADRLEREFSSWRWAGRGRVLEALSKASGGVVESSVGLSRFERRCDMTDGLFCFRPAGSSEWTDSCFLSSMRASRALT